MTRGILIFTVLLLGLAGAIWSAGAWLASRAEAPIGPVPPNLMALAAREVAFPSASGARIEGWFVERSNAPATILLMHGVRANRLSMVARAKWLAREGYSVLLFDFQGHGESGGDRITFGHLESRDARAAVQYLRRERPEEKIGVIGVSLGGAAALLAEPPLDVQAMILESVYPTIEEAVRDRLVMRLGALGGWLTPLLTGQLRPRLGVGPEALRPIDRAGKLAVPKFFLHGEADRHTTLREARALADAAAAPKQFWMISGAGHVDLHEYAGREYERRVLAFFRERGL